MNTTDEARSRQRYLAVDHNNGFHAQRRDDCQECLARLLTPDEQNTLLDIVRRYHAGDQPASVTMAWIYGLVANSKLNNGSL